METATKTELKAAEKEWFVTSLKKEESLKTTLSPMRLCALVETNPMLAIECFIRLSSMTHITSYLTAFVAMSMSFNSIDVVSRLIHSIAPPPRFVQGYVVKCVRSCTQMKGKPDLQEQYVRRICALLY